MSVVVSKSVPIPGTSELLPYVILGGEPTGTGVWGSLTGRSFDLATDYGHERGDWYLRCNIPLIGPGTRALMFSWRGHGLPDLGGLMKITDSPVKRSEPNAPKGYLWYVWGEIRSLYPTDEQIPGEVIAANPNFSGTRPLKPVPNRFQCGERYLESDVQACISHLSEDVQNWFWA